MRACGCELHVAPTHTPTKNYISANYIPSKMISLRDADLLVNCTSQDQPDLHHLRWVVYQVVFPVLVSLGVVANLLNLIVLSRPAMRGVAYRYLNHLAVSDLLYLVFNVPFCMRDFAYISEMKMVSKPSAVYYANVGIPLVNMFLTMSEYIVVWLSYDRCLAVCSPRKFSAKQRLEVVRIRCSMSLLLTMFVYSLSPLRQTYHCEGVECCVTESEYADEPWYMGYEFFREIYSRFLPAMLVTAFNVAIVVTLKQIKRGREGPDVTNEAREERERRLFFLLMAITVLFYISAFPSAIYKVLMFNDMTFIPYFRAVADVLEVSGHVFNFVLYFLFSPDYRKTLVDMIYPHQHYNNEFAMSSTAIPL
ncbi:probable G-protein coupled receptor B0563.6 isoform X1 [Panulirus ornatus]|uniref:probable G-protein coupled receptor B0563.6 isoform X1 n=1 Tax=Panulirus ornatus TaxID=150431 RepID=UPI003A8AFBE4